MRKRYSNVLFCVSGPRPRRTIEAAKDLPTRCGVLVSVEIGLAEAFMARYQVCLFLLVNAASG